jgi:hypothetical protein
VINKIFLFFIMICISLNVFSEESIENLPREKSKSLGKWEVIPTLKTIDNKKVKIKSTDVLLKRGQKVYVKRVHNKNRPLLALESDDESQVVYNPKRKSVGTVNGTLVIKLSNIADEKSLLLDYPLKKIRLEKKIKFGIYKVKAGNDIAQVYENLTKDSRVKNVEIEVISNTGGLKPL